MSYYMNYWYHNQPMCSSALPPVSKNGSYCGISPTGIAFCTGQQWPMQKMPPQPMAMQQAIPSQPPLVSSGSSMTPTGSVFPLPTEQSYIENILRLNLGKMGTFYMTYENNTKWNAKVFHGVIEAAGRDHIILSDPETGQRIILLMVNFDYATFDEPLYYEYTPGQPSRTKE